MRITFVLPPVNMSGGIRVTAVHARGLQDRGHEVVLVSPPPREPSTRRKVRALLSGRGWPTREPRRSHLDGADLDHRVVESYRPICDRDLPDSDVVVATWWETAEWVRALSPRKGAKIYFIQGHEVFGHLPVERCHATYRLPMHKIVIARWLRDIMREQYGDDSVDIVPNSVDSKQFFAAPRGMQPAPTVGLLYSTIRSKGLPLSLAALEVLRRRIPRLRVVSFGSERPSKELCLPAFAEFSHSPPQDKLRDLYARCDVWLTASTTEGFNLPAMEAMACRTPVVSTKTGWPADALATGHNGVLVDIGDVGGLAQGLEWVLTLTNERWQSLSQRAFETATAGSWQESVRQFEEALFNALRRAERGEIAGGRGPDLAMPTSA
jgi:glycosyltransferase involved in cell wall biosynthesis